MRPLCLVELELALWLLVQQVLKPLRQWLLVRLELLRRLELVLVPLLLLLLPGLLLAHFL